MTFRSWSGILVQQLFIPGSWKTNKPVVFIMQGLEVPQKEHKDGDHTMGCYQARWMLKVLHQLPLNLRQRPCIVQVSLQNEMCPWTGREWETPCWMQGGGGWVGGLFSALLLQGVTPLFTASSSTTQPPSILASTICLIGWMCDSLLSGYLCETCLFKPSSH